MFSASAIEYASLSLGVRLALKILLRVSTGISSPAIAIFLAILVNDSTDPFSQVIRFLTLSAFLEKVESMLLFILLVFAMLDF